MCRSQWEETRESKAGLTTACAGLRISRSCAHARVRTPCPLPSTSSSARVCASPRSQTISLLPIHPQVCLCVCVCVFASMHMCMRTHARMCASSRACVFSCAICTGMCHTLDAGIRTNLWLRPLPMRCVRRCMYVQIYAHGRERKHACVRMPALCMSAHSPMHTCTHTHAYNTESLLRTSCPVPLRIRLPTPSPHRLLLPFTGCPAAIFGRRRSSLCSTAWPLCFMPRSR